MNFRFQRPEVRKYNYIPQFYVEGEDKKSNNKSLIVMNLQKDYITAGIKEQVEGKEYPTLSRLFGL